MNIPLDILKKVFGYASFRKGQDALIEQILKGRDVLGIMPTGAGKSLCYQVPALAAGGLSVVVSPLISLMKDQVDSLRQNGVGAVALHSSMEWEEVRETLSSVRRGKVPLLYVAPERFGNEMFLEFFATLDVKIFVVDEAHCISQWGHDFRPAYLKLPSVVERLSARPVVAAFTATATPEVRDDIVTRLDLKNPFLLTTSFDRKNLFFQVQHPKDKSTFLLSYVQKLPGLSGIVYCSTRRAVEDVCDFLRARKIDAVRYHAGLDDAEKIKNQEAFIYDRASLMVATNAFGMGIDKSNVRYVVHYNMPGSIENYYQEAGRAGRDGASSECVLLYAPQDVMTIRRFIEKDGSAADVRQSGYRKLQSMIDYCNTGQCLRSTILSYFGETGGGTAKSCDFCDNCVSDAGRVDITRAAKMILSCVYRMKERTGQSYGVTLLSDVLRGSQKDSVKNYGFDKISTWGLMREYNGREIREIVDFLAADGYLKVSEGEYPVLSFTPKTRPFLTDPESEKLLMRKRARLTKGEGIEEKGEEKKGAREAPGRKTAPVNQELFERLRQLRKELAGEQGVPPYVVFADATLHGICAALPADAGEFLSIPGVGQVKLERYGERFLQAVRDWRSGREEEEQ